MTTTVIRNAGWAILWDATARRHVYRRNVDIAFKDDRIVHAGPGFAGQVDVAIDGASRLVMPGMVNVHTHCMSENIGRGITEELGNPALYMSALYDLKSVFLVGHSMSPDQGHVAGFRAATDMAVSEILLSGGTTVVDLAVPYEGWLDGLAATGIRAVAAPMYRSARWVVRRGNQVEYEWDEAAGRRAFTAALAVVDAAARHPSGRLSGMVSPAQVDTCSESLLRDSLAAAVERGLPLTVHCSQSVVEFQEMARRHGKSPVQWLADIGLLGPHTLLGHTMFVDSQSWVGWWSRRDVPLLAETKTSVAHCPTVFSRYGQTMESFGAYVRAGINMALGTDTQPHNMLEELRTALVLSRIASCDVHLVELADAFHAATVGGTTALGRDDLARIAPGAKADLVLVDLDHPAMQPARDPLRGLVFSAADRAVRDVFVDGRQVVSAGEVTTIDRRAAAERLTRAQHAVMAAVPAVDHARRTADQVSPLSLPLG